MRKDPYLDALRAMHDLLGALGEQHWRTWIAEDIREWESRKSVQHHMSAYGGMGSFNDVVFEDPWMNVLFEDLKSICYFFAHQPIPKLYINALERSFGQHGFELTGWRCLVVTGQFLVGTSTISSSGGSFGKRF